MQKIALWRPKMDTLVCNHPSTYSHSSAFLNDVSLILHMSKVEFHNFFDVMVEHNLSKRIEFIYLLIYIMVAQYIYIYIEKHQYISKVIEMIF